jgi:hypothetical protein
MKYYYIYGKTIALKVKGASTRISKGLSSQNMCESSTLNINKYYSKPVSTFTHI